MQDARMHVTLHEEDIDRCNHGALALNNLRKKRTDGAYTCLSGEQVVGLDVLYVSC